MPALTDGCIYKCVLEMSTDAKYVETSEWSSILCSISISATDSTLEREFSCFALSFLSSLYFEAESLVLFKKLRFGDQLAVGISIIIHDGIVLIVNFANIFYAILVATTRISNTLNVFHILSVRECIPFNG